MKKKRFQLFETVFRVVNCPDLPIIFQKNRTYLQHTQ